MKPPSRPYVICHMVPSVDGRIVTTNWNLPRGALAQYELTAGTFAADAWIIGRVSMEPFAGKARIPKRREGGRIPRTDFIAKRHSGSYAIAIDPSGKLAWKSNAIDDELVITVLSERVSDDYLAFLQAKGVSYLFGGRTRIDLNSVLHKLAGGFGIRRLLLEGGGKINGSFLAADLVDELSVLIAPIADGAVAAPTLFDAAGGKCLARRLKLVSCKRRGEDLVWLRYRVRRRR
jgi:2,5-diamino-6-(ribosylamino)-4(3H)-pyrimidinone 5'-phosphate reductase